MVLFANIFVGLTAILHILFFKLESIDFMKPKTLRRFGLNSTSGAFVKTWAFNHGFYNLFLALGLLYSMFLINTGQIESGKVLANFILLLIVGAGVILAISAPKKYVAAITQAVPALLGILFIFFSFN